MEEAERATLRVVVGRMVAVDSGSFLLAPSTARVDHCLVVSSPQEAQEPLLHGSVLQIQD